MGKSTFYLKKSCPICGQGSSLVFLTCPECQTIIIACEEEGSIFYNPREIIMNNVIGNYIENGKCPNCEKKTVQDFLPSKGEDIQNLGFTINDYE